MPSLEIKILRIMIPYSLFLGRAFIKITYRLQLNLFRNSWIGSRVKNPEILSSRGLMSQLVFSRRWNRMQGGSTAREVNDLLARREQAGQVKTLFLPVLI